MSDYLKELTIMVVDDQSFITSMLRQILKVLGAENIYLFADGESAWEFFLDKQVDLIFMDWQMQPISGIELTKRIRTSLESTNMFVPIIMVTAFREREHVFKARDAGVTEYVVKPISPKSLFSRIDAVIEKPRQFIRIGEFFGPDRRRQKKGYSGNERRGQDKPEKENSEPKPTDNSKEMGQDEINTTFNLDDKPEPSSPGSKDTTAD